MFFCFSFPEPNAEIETALPVVGNFKKVLPEAISRILAASMMKEYMQGLKKFLLVDVTKHYSEQPCQDSGPYLSVKPQELLN